MARLCLSIPASETVDSLRSKPASMISTLGMRTTSDGSRHWTGPKTESRSRKTPPVKQSNETLSITMPPSNEMPTGWFLERQRSPRRQFWEPVQLAQTDFTAGIVGASKYSPSRRLAWIVEGLRYNGVQSETIFRSPCTVARHRTKFSQVFPCVF